MGFIGSFLEEGHGRMVGTAGTRHNKHIKEIYALVNDPFEGPNIRGVTAVITSTQDPPLTVPLTPGLAQRVSCPGLQPAFGSISVY